MYYRPGSAPNDTVEGLAVYVQRELEQIGLVLSVMSFLELHVMHVAPGKPRDGMVVFADGSDWNPGGGEGYYGYYNAAWNKLG